MRESLHPTTDIGRVHAALAAEARDLGWRVIAERRTLWGQHVWRVIESAAGARIVMLAIVRRAGSGFRVTEMSERESPAATDCPLELLELCPPPDETARRWRGRVRLGAARSEIAVPSPGTRVTIYGQPYEVVSTRGAECLVRGQDGRIYRATGAMLGGAA